MEYNQVFEELCKRLGCPQWLVNDLAIIILLTSVIFIVSKQFLNLYRFISLAIKQRRLNKDLHPYYSPGDVERSTRFYVPLKYQNVAPSEDEEPGRRYVASAKNKITPLFLKKVFRSTNTNKFYFILADSGMGKTTFLINLYISYKNQLTFFSTNPKYDIKLFPLGKQGILDDIVSIDDKDNTILLLDAFDEDLEALSDYKSRLNTILNAVHKFRFIVITCRTQFFPSKEEEPHETGYFSFGEDGEYNFQKLYLSVFDNKEVTKYLQKRYSVVFQFAKFRKAICNTPHY